MYFLSFLVLKYLKRNYTIVISESLFTFGCIKLKIQVFRRLFISFESIDKKLIKKIQILFKLETHDRVQMTMNSLLYHVVKFQFIRISTFSLSTRQNFIFELKITRSFLLYSQKWPIPLWTLFLRRVVSEISMKNWSELRLSRTDWTLVHFFW